MRLVQRRTGLGADLLRAWERRHGAVHPARSPGGQRLYRDTDVERLLLLKRLIDEGHAISSIASLPTDELRAMVPVGDLAAEPASTDVESVAPSGDALARACRAVDTLNDRELDATLRSAVVTSGVVATVEGLVVPLLHWIGERWARDELSPAHEHLASGVIVRVLHWMRDASTAAVGAPGIAFATTQGEFHELGIQATAAVAAAAGWRVTFLGADLPDDAIANAVRFSGASVVGLSIVAATGSQRGLDHLLALRASLPEETAIIVGGAGVVAIADRLRMAQIDVVTSIPLFRAYLGTKWLPGKSI